MCFSIRLLEVVVAVLGRGQRWAVGRGGQRWAGTSGNQLGAEAQFPLSAGTSGPGESLETTHTFLLARESCGLTFSKPRSEVRVLQELSEEKRGGCDADVRRAVEPGAHLPGDCGIRQNLAQRWDF